MIGQTVLHAEGDYTQLLRTLEERNVRRLFLVCGKNSGKLPAAAFVRSLPEKAGIAVEIFSDFEPNPKYESVAKGVRRLRSFGGDAVLAIGGGSAIDTAKCIKLYSGLDPSQNMLQVKDEAMLRSDVLLIAVPTTAGTGSEATCFAVIYYEGNKQSVEHETILPSIVLLDPSVLRNLPAYQRRATMMDALSHAMESFWCVNSTPESRAVSSDAIRAVLGAVNGYLENTEEGNRAMQLAAYRAGQAINLTRTTAGHAMCYKLTSLYGIAHGQACALVNTKLLPYMAAHTGDCADPRGEAYLRGMFGSLAGVMDCTDAEEASRKFQSLYDRMEFPSPWKGNVDEEQLQALNAGVNPDRLKNNPIRLDAAAIDTLYRRILA